jgi:uncharacterized coiled-coil protein SlyX
MVEDVDTESEERIEELETQVADLEATVRGLTEELVDRTERIRQLEAQTGVVGAESESVDDADPAADADGVGPDADTEESADGAAENLGEEDKREGAEEEGNGEKSGEGDDIIVA